MKYLTLKGKVNVECQILFNVYKAVQTFYSFEEKNYHASIDMLPWVLKIITSSRVPQSDIYDGVFFLTT